MVSQHLPIPPPQCVQARTALLAGPVPAIATTRGRAARRLAPLHRIRPAGPDRGGPRAL